MLHDECLAIIFHDTTSLLNKRQKLSLLVIWPPFQKVRKTRISTHIDMLFQLTYLPNFNDSTKLQIHGGREARVQFSIPPQKKIEKQKKKKKQTKTRKKLICSQSLILSSTTDGWNPLTKTFPMLLQEKKIYKLPNPVSFRVLKTLEKGWPYYPSRVSNVVTYKLLSFCL